MKFQTATLIISWWKKYLNLPHIPNIDVYGTCRHVKMRLGRPGGTLCPCGSPCLLSSLCPSDFLAHLCSSWGQFGISVTLYSSKSFSWTVFTMNWFNYSIVIPLHEPQCMAMQSETFRTSPFRILFSRCQSLFKTVKCSPIIFYLA